MSKTKELIKIGSKVGATLAVYTGFLHVSSAIVCDVCDNIAIAEEAKEELKEKDEIHREKLMWRTFGKQVVAGAACAYGLYNLYGKALEVIWGKENIKR